MKKKKKVSKKDKNLKKEIENILKCPEGISAYNFEYCDTHGGQAHRRWCYLMKHKGIFIGFRNYDWIVFASSDPEASWSRGCTDPCAFGDDLPYSPTAKLVPITELPPEGQRLAIKWVKEAIEIARNIIEESKRKRALAEKLELEKQRIKHEQEVVKPWKQAAQKEGI